jgi:hypothetical protein
MRGGRPPSGELTVNPRIRIVAASAFLAACAVSRANAAVEIDTEFAFIGAAIKPNDVDLSKATSIAFGAIIVEAVLADNTDLALDTLLTLTNPIRVGVGDMLTLSWKTVEGTFSATLTEKDLSPSPNQSQAITATGTVVGPDGFSSSPVQAGFIFDQDGSDYSMHGGLHTLTSEPSVPEPSTWAMMLIGFGGLCVLASRRSRHTANAGASSTRWRSQTMPPSRVSQPISRSDCPAPGRSPSAP